MIFVFPFLQLISLSIEHFDTPLVAYFWSYFPQLAVVTLVLVTLPSVFLTSSLTYRFGGFLLSLAIALYFQANIFLWDYGLVDGSFFDFSGKFSIAAVEVVFWIAIGIVGVVFGLSVFNYRLYIISVLLLMVVANTIMTPGFDRFAGKATRISSEPFYKYGKSWAVKAKRASTFSTKKNVVVWISDGLQSDISKEILDTSPKLRQNLKGFTFFEDAMGHYDQTILSIPLLLAGKVYDGKQSYENFLETRVKTNNIGYFANVEGITSDMISSRKFCAGFERCLFSGALMPIERIPARSAHLATVISLSAFRLMPHIVKPLVFDGVNGIGNSLLSFLYPEQEEQPWAAGDVRFYNWFIEELQAEETAPTLKVLHSRSSHQPYQLGRNCTAEKSRSNIDALKKQAYCNMTIFLNFVLKLKELDIYDQTMIVWISDHGSRQKYADIQDGPYGSEMSDASVTFAVKPVGSSTKPLVYSSAPVQLADVAPTVLSAFEIPFEHYEGLPVFQVQPDNRHRQYFSTNRKSPAKELSGYEVVGRKSNHANWTPTKTLFTNKQNR